MKAGELNRRITVLEPVESRSGSGEITVTYEPAEAIGAGDGKVWANVRPVAGQKYFAADATNSRVSHTILVRYQPGFNTKQRVRLEVEPGIFSDLEIEAALQLDTDRTKTVLMCVMQESAGFR